MTGSYDIEVISNKLKYELTIRRNITVIRGDSATGKTQLIQLIRDYNLYGKDSGITIHCSRSCVVVEGIQWMDRIREVKDSIIFIDEGNGFIRSHEFARLLEHSSNYFVLITRENLDALPYSVKEIYGFRESPKYKGIRPVYNEAYPLYEETSIRDVFSHCAIITEDSNSGYDFFNSVAQGYHQKCTSAHGKTNVLNTLITLNQQEKNILVIVDGAAFGPEIEDIVNYLNYHKGISFYAPESFEWMILKSGIIDLQTDLLDNTSEYVDSEIYVSWERFFTHQLISLTEHTAYQYSKHRLNSAYLSARNKKMIMEIMLDMVQ